MPFVSPCAEHRAQGSVSSRCSVKGDRCCCLLLNGALERESRLVLWQTQIGCVSPNSSDLSKEGLGQAAPPVKSSRS